MYHVSAQDVDECMINVHYYYYKKGRRFDFTALSSAVVECLPLLPFLRFKKND